MLSLKTFHKTNSILKSRPVPSTIAPSILPQCFYSFRMSMVQPNSVELLSDSVIIIAQSLIKSFDFVFMSQVGEPIGGLLLQLEIVLMLPWRFPFRYNINTVTCCCCCSSPRELTCVSLAVLGFILWWLPYLPVKIVWRPQ